IRGEHRTRMRIERDDDRVGPALAPLRDDTGQDLLVPRVHAVEISECDDRRREAVDAAVDVSNHTHRVSDHPPRRGVEQYDAATAPSRRSAGELGELLSPALRLRRIAVLAHQLL